MAECSTVSATAWLVPPDLRLTYLSNKLIIEPSNQERFPFRGNANAFANSKNVEVDDWDDSDASFSILQILQTVWARRLWVLAASLLGMVCALAFSLSQTPLYRATAIIELNPPIVPILSGGAGAGEDLVAPTTDWQFLETQLGMLRSRALAERVAQDLNLASRTNEVEAQPPSITQLANSILPGLTVTPAQDSRLVELNYVSDNAIKSANLANGFAESFVQLTLDRKYEATKTARVFLGDRLLTVRGDLNKAERELVEYAKENNIIPLAVETADGSAGSSSLTGSSLAALNAALASSQEKRIQAEQRFRQGGAISEVGAATDRLRQERATLRAEYEEKATYMQDDFPDLVRLNNRIDELDRQIDIAKSQASAGLEAEYKAALAQENSLRLRVAELSADALNEREDSIQYNTLKRELDTNRALYDALLARYNEVGVAEGIGTAQAAIVDKALAPRAPFSPNVLLNTALGTVLGLLAGAGLAALYEFHTNTIKTKEDVNEKLKLASLGAIPVKDKASELISQLGDKGSQIYESYASLLTTLHFSTRDGFPKALLVTSSNPAEGKSTTSYGLAMQLADSGKKVLLIDADMRRPTFVVGEQSDFGLSRVLTTAEGLREHILRTSQHNFFLMPSGPIPPNPANILRPARLKELLKELSPLFDAVIIDAPPSLGFADALLLGSVCDGTLFAVESGKTRTSAAISAINQLHMAGVQILGAVLTKANFSTNEYGYSYRYYHSALDRDQRSELVAGLIGDDNQSERWQKADL